MKLYCCILSALLSCLICGIYAKYDDNLHGPFIAPPTFEEPGTTIETTTATELPGTTTETTKSEEKERGTTTETTTTKEHATTTQEPVTINQKNESIKYEAETMIETTTTEEPGITDTTTTITTTIDTTTADTTTIDTTTTVTTTADTTTADTTTLDTTTTDTTTTARTTTTTTVSPNNIPCTPPWRKSSDIYRKSSDCSYLKSGTILVDAQHCRRYYVCNAAYRAIRLRCPNNEWFDRQKLKCRHRSLVRNCPPNRN